MQRQVVITGAGLISPLGNTALALHDALCMGRPTFTTVERLAGASVTNGLASALTEFDPRAYFGSRNFRPLDRPSQLLAVAAQLGLEDSGFTADQVAEHEVGLVAGTMFGGMHTIAEFDRRAMQEGPTRASALDFANTVINAAAGQAAIWHKLTGVNSTIAAGATSGLQALSYATDLIRVGQSRAILSGGFDELSFESMVGFVRAEWSCNAEQHPLPIPFDMRRNGCCLSEGAGLVMLEDAATARERKAIIRGEIKGAGSRYDATISRTPLSDGSFIQSVELAADAIHAALMDAKLAARDIDCVFASANGSLFGDRIEAAALQLVFADRIDPIPVTAHKSVTGESLGSAAAFQVISFVEMLRDGRLPGIHGLEQAEPGFPQLDFRRECRELEAENALVMSIGFDGHYCCLVVGRDRAHGKFDEPR